eukprot:TRINITY_DN4231_c0_g1_i1.p1 TRINITY_DN4231_c0_g1~~TRINITY_DN4231_c0_g1_i1.p1  ORF type:complete len:211 (-),score=54.74 TRINITY_DN4231_c0_g1_i1:106-738(-)
METPEAAERRRQQLAGGGNEAGHQEPCFTFHTPVHRVVIFTFVIVPVAVLIIAFCFGALLALLEGWTVRQGFYYVVGNLTGMATPLTTVTPTSTYGKMVDVIVAVYSLALAGLIIGLMTNFALVNEVTEKVEGMMDDQTIQDLHTEIQIIKAELTVRALNKKESPVEPGFESQARSNSLSSKPDSSEGKDQDHDMAELAMPGILLDAPID